MEDGQKISDYGIKEDSTVHLVVNLRDGGYTKQSLGLVNTAQAISLWDWDGIMPGPVSLTLVVNIYRQSYLPLLLRVSQLAFDCPRAKS